MEEPFNLLKDTDPSITEIKNVFISLTLKLLSFSYYWTEHRATLPHLIFRLKLIFPFNEKKASKRRTSVFSLSFFLLRHCLICASYFSFIFFLLMFLFLIKNWEWMKIMFHRFTTLMTIYGGDRRFWRSVKTLRITRAAFKITSLYVKSCEIFFSFSHSPFLAFCFLFNARIISGTNLLISLSLPFCHSGVRLHCVLWMCFLFCFQQKSEINLKLILTLACIIQLMKFDLQIFWMSESVNVAVVLFFLINYTYQLIVEIKSFESWYDIIVGARNDLKRVCQNYWT